MDKNVLGIIDKNRSTKLGSYYFEALKFEALKFYDDIIFIDPLQVNYSIPKNSIPIIEQNGLCLNDLSMVYLFSIKKGTRRHVNLLLRALMMAGCPISDNFERFNRYDIGKAYETLKKIGTKGDIPCYIVSSYESAEILFRESDSINFPLVIKPIFGNKGRGIRKFDSPKPTLSYLRRHFLRTESFVMLEEYINFSNEWRVYVVDGHVVCSYERVRQGQRIASNLHRGGSVLETAAGDILSLTTFVLETLVAEYKEGIYGVDVGRSIDGNLYIIETNRRPGWEGVKAVSDINFPYEANRILFERARKYNQSAALVNHA